MSACFCMGPQNGEPLCPCAMHGLKIVNGRWVRIEDFGPAPTGWEPRDEDEIIFESGQKVINTIERSMKNVE